MPTLVPSGSLVSPGGQQGVPGAKGVVSATTNTAAFTVPAVGSTVTVSVVDASWPVIGEYLWVQSAGGDPNTPLAMQVTATTVTPPTITLLNPVPTSVQPSGDANNLLTVGSDSLLYLPPSAVQPTIWTQQLRAFSALGNPTFEVDQKNVGTTIAAAPSATFCLDRFHYHKGGTMVLSYGQQSGTVALPNGFPISRSFLRFTLTTAQASLAAGDQLWFGQGVEGPCLRELINDVHSVQIYARSSVANLVFSLFLKDVANTFTLTKLCALGAANTWTLISLPALPIWAGGATWSTAPGVAAYTFGITLAAGSSLLTSPDVWASGSFIGATGMSNFAASAVNSTFDLAYVSHVPGPNALTIDKPFDQNYHECLRYYCKSYPYGVKAPTASVEGYETWLLPFNTTSSAMRGTTKFPRPMAKTPAVSTWTFDGTGAGVSIIAPGQTVANFGINAVNAVTDRGFSYISAVSAYGASYYAAIFHYVGDTGF